MSLYHVGVYLQDNVLIAGNEEVKLTTLSALGSWGSRSSDAIQPDVVSFIASGLKEKEALRRGHLRCLRSIFNNADAVSLVRWL